MERKWNGRGSADSTRWFSHTPLGLHLALGVWLHNDVERDRREEVLDKRAELNDRTRSGATAMRPFGQVH